MLFENKDFMNALETFGLDMSKLVNFKKVDNEPKKESDRFWSVEEGFLRGNLVRSEYKPYKNMTYLPYNPKTEREALLIPVYAYDNALTDLSFILDLNPEDKEAFLLFKQYVESFKKARDDYEKVYGPLYLYDAIGEVYDWVDNPWPWDQDRGSMYV